MRKDKDNPIPQYLRDEIDSMVKIKDYYTKEDVEKIMKDWKLLEKQKKSLEDAKEWGAIPKEEATITEIMLMAKQLVLQETSARARKQLEREREEIIQKINELKGN